MAANSSISLAAPPSGSAYSFLELAGRILDSWDVLGYAVKHGLGGVESEAKRVWLSTAVQEYFRQNSDLEIDEVEDMISDVLDAEFNLLVEDGSVRNIAKLLREAHRFVEQNQLDKIAELISGLPSNAALQKAKENSRFASNGHCGDRVDDSDEDAYCAMDSGTMSGMQNLSIQSDHSSLLIGQNSGTDSEFRTIVSGGGLINQNVNSMTGGFANVSPNQPMNELESSSRDAMSSEDSGLSMDESWPINEVDTVDSTSRKEQPISEYAFDDSRNDGWTKVAGKKNKKK